MLHYCVTNMPGAVGRTSTFALCNVTLPWVLQLANRGIDQACQALAAARLRRQHPRRQRDQSGGGGDVWDEFEGVNEVYRGHPNNSKILGQQTKAAGVG